MKSNDQKCGHTVTLSLIPCYSAVKLALPSCIVGLEYGLTLQWLLVGLVMLWDVQDCWVLMCE